MLKLKKSLAIGSLLFGMCLSQAQAQEGGTGIEYYLALIAQYTKGTLEAVNTVPTLVESFVAFALAWTNPDESKSTPTLQSSFANLSTMATTDTAAQTALQGPLMHDFFGPTINSDNLPIANDLTYSTLLGQLYFDPDPRSKNKQQQVDPAYNYLKNAAGISIRFPLPTSSGPGNPNAKIQYLYIYNTVSSVQTYNAYLLSQLYTQYKNGSATSKQQAQLIEQASNSEWFAEVASEKIGVVLRQILMFDSQIYVTLTQMLQMQQQLLTAIAMNNTLLISLNRLNSNALLDKANGTS